MADEDRVTAVYDLEDDEETFAAPTVPPPEADGSTHGARLIVLEGGSRGRGWTLGQRTQIGRSPRADVCIDDTLASREHAILSRDEAGWMIRDLGARNGTHVNGRRIDVERLRFGDRISIGHTVLLLAHLDPAHEQLIERQKIEALGRLCAGIAHDLNNYFGAVLGAVDYLDGSPTDLPLADRGVRECLDDVRAATQRGADLTRRLLSFARRGGEEHAPLEMARLIADAVELARRTFDRSISIETKIAPSLTVRGDAGRLHQVLMNLLVNARDAMPRGGAIDVVAESITLPDGTAHAVRLVVADAGVGMDEATRARMFEPFFTTKSPEKGTGLGLAIVLDVVSSHGGTIACDSAPGAGTRFTITLPSASPGPRLDARTPIGFAPVPSPVKRSVTVLVVDDEEIVRRSMRRLIEREGHTVLEAGNGRRAIEAVQAEPAIALVLMDLDMPEVDGERACREIAALRPGLPVLILSGLCDQIRRQRLERLGARAVLHKPCDVGTLSRAIAAAMDAG